MRDLLGTLPTVSGVGTTGTAIDRGLAGVTVIAVDSAGVVRGAAPTGIDGAYTLTLTAHGGRFQRRVRLATAIYEPTVPTVWLRSARPLPLRFQYRLIINATSPTGVTDTAGRLLDGNGDGVPGGDYVQVFGREALVRAHRRSGPRGAGVTRELGRGYRLLARGNALAHRSLA